MLSGPRVSLRPNGASRVRAVPLEGRVRSDQRHTVALRAEPVSSMMRVDGRPVANTHTTTDGGSIRLVVAVGQVEFDDMEVVIDRNNHGGARSAAR